MESFLRLFFKSTLTKKGLITLDKQMKGLGSHLVIPGMGSSLTNVAITIVGKCIYELVKILQQFSKQSYTKDMKLLVRQLLLVSEVYAKVPESTLDLEQVCLRKIRREP